MKLRLIMAVLAATTLTTGLARAADVDAGKKLYVDNCQKCHGTKGQGGIGVKLAGDAAYWDAAPFKKAVMDGIDDEGKKLKPVMPHWGKTGFLIPKGVMPTDDDLANIEAFLQTLGPKTAN